jgi:hypothetical protein
MLATVVALCNKAGGAVSSLGPLRKEGRLRHMTHHCRIRWYNPRLNAFEWREVPESGEEALSLLEDSPYSPICTETYQEWRDLGAPIAEALIRAGEAAKQD